MPLNLLSKHVSQQHRFDSPVMAVTDGEYPPEDLVNLLTVIEQQGENDGVRPAGPDRMVRLSLLCPVASAPLVAGFGRVVAYASAVAAMLRRAGCHIELEAYAESEGPKMDVLAASVWLRYLELCGEQIPYPDGALPGDYVFDFAASVHRQHGNQLQRSAAELLPPTESGVVIKPETGSVTGANTADFDAVIERCKSMLSSAEYDICLETARTAILADMQRDLADMGFAVQFVKPFGDSEPAIVNVANVHSGRDLTQNGLVSTQEAEHIVIAATGHNDFPGHQSSDASTRLLTVQPWSVGELIQSDDDHDAHENDHDHDHDHNHEEELSLRELRDTLGTEALRLCALFPVQGDCLADLDPVVGSERGNIACATNDRFEIDDPGIDSPDLDATEIVCAELKQQQRLLAAIFSVQARLARRLGNKMNPEAVRGVTPVVTPGSCQAAPELGVMTLCLSRFPGIVDSALQQANPAQLAVYLLQLAGQLNTYKQGSLLADLSHDNLDTLDWRLMKTCNQVLTNAMTLLGMPVIKPVLEPLLEQKATPNE